jgi:DNA/RNA-binding domain of Phe-tRNA-synthetase-like protein
MRSATELQKLVDSAVVTRDVFELLPDYLVLLIAVDGITPSCSDGTSEKLLQIAESAAKERLASTAITEFPSVKIWRNCYKLFGAKPKKY